MYCVLCLAAYCDVALYTHLPGIPMLSFFVFQAEDGIRDLVRSRGLGDVYKRQAITRAWPAKALTSIISVLRGRWKLVTSASTTWKPVSYTHLTLPTSDLV